MKIFSALCLSLLILTGCATSYQPRGLSGGFEEIRLDDNIFKVSFKGNQYTSKEKAMDYAVLRSSEIALAHNFKFFVIKGSEDYSKISTEYNVQRNNQYYNRYSNTPYTVSQDTTTKPRIALLIECYTDRPVTGSALYNAEMTRENIKHKYDIQ